jgi:hypothetical protein
MRIREDGKFSWRTSEIEAASNWWGCNKTEALLRSAELVRALDSGIQNVLERDDLTPVQKREIAESLSVAGSYEVDVQEEIVVDK